MAARVESPAGGADDGARPSIPSPFKNHLQLGATEAIMWIACRRHFSHEMIREHLAAVGAPLQMFPALQTRVDKAQLQLFRLIIDGVPATGTLDYEGHPDHNERVPLPAEFLKDGAYIELLSGHLRADLLLEKHSLYERRAYRYVEIDRDAFFKALAAAEPQSQATDAKPIELADASTATDTPNPEVPTEAHKAEPPPKDLTSAARSKGGRKPGSGAYMVQDRVLWKKMKAALEQGDAVSPWGAAGLFAEEAPGEGHFDSKRRRLARGYSGWIITQ